jgi:hypothetical protein
MVGCNSERYSQNGVGGSHQHAAPQDGRGLDDAPVGCAVAKAQGSHVHAERITAVRNLKKKGNMARTVNRH